MARRIAWISPFARFRHLDRDLALGVIRPARLAHFESAQEFSEVVLRAGEVHLVEEDDGQPIGERFGFIWPVLPVEVHQ